MRRLTITKRKWLLTIHLLFSSIMLGVAVIYLILSITAANTNDEGLLKACYIIMHKLSMTAGRYSTIGTVLTGILLSVLTQWGLFKFYWIIVKEGLTLISILLGPIAMYFLTLNAVTLTTNDGLNALLEPAYTVNKWQMWIGIILQIISLVSMFVISVFKPWGPRKQKQQSRIA
ncbi:hypothetical protein [Neobacillus vireti]|uniref:Integral membrane protein n=1 Tax=Neobacillus vireti LMG 21834 TaxID=1131730 RepID=A0AB94INB4_9BACI|nr:hypothetical protein [Neobacillus vireti]ETI68472.1 hypothetical protein BAVI_12304 [Neobacillus vireti LMG 21834]KLT17751.1 hypothetical protein AA980_11640 [Neobacillus vireti]